MGFILVIILSLSAVSAAGCGSEFETLFDKPVINTADNPGTGTGTTVLYWTENNGTINRINIDGTGRKTIITSSYIPRDIAIDTSAGRIFWAEFTGSEYQIRRVGFDGSSPWSVYSISISQTLDCGPVSIAIDNTGGNIFWSVYSSSSGKNNIWFSAINTDTLTGTKWSNELACAYTYSICIDSIHGKFYFTDNSYYDIGATIGSGNAGDVYIGELGMAKMEQQKTSLTGPSDPSVPFKGIAVDGNGGHVYYVNNVVHGTWPKNITRTDLSLQNDNNGNPWIYQGVADIQKLALDLTNRKIYWTSETDNKIYRADLDLADSNVEVFLNLDYTPTGIAIPQ